MLNMPMAISGVGCDHDGKALARMRPADAPAAQMSGRLGSDRVPTSLAMTGALRSGLALWRDASGLSDAVEAGWLALGAAGTAADHPQVATAELPAAGAWTGESWRGVAQARKSAAMPVLEQAARLFRAAAPITQDTSAAREAATFAHLDQAKASNRRQHVRSRGPSPTESPA